MVEFAFVLPLLCIVLFCLLEFGYQSYVNSMMQGTLFEAARLAAVGDKTGDQIDTHVRKRLRMLSQSAEITINKRSYRDFTGIGKPEDIVRDTIPLGTYNQTDCFRDANGNGVYDRDQGRNGLGGGDDVVNYEVAMTYKRLLPVASMMGFPPMVTVTAATPLRNQPFAVRLTGPEICPQT